MAHDREKEKMLLSELGMQRIGTDWSSHDSQCKMSSVQSPHSSLPFLSARFEPEENPFFSEIILSPRIDSSHRVAALERSSSMKSPEEGKPVDRPGFKSKLPARISAFAKHKNLMGMEKKVSFQRKEAHFVQQSMDSTNVKDIMMDKSDASSNATDEIHNWRQSVRKCYSQPFPLRDAKHDASKAYSGPISRSMLRRKDDSYTLFRTRSMRREKDMFCQPSIDQHEEETATASPIGETAVPAFVPPSRYFDALRGPELEVLKESEEILLPRDQKWPFLLRFPIGCFGISLGLGSQTILWKNLSTMSSMVFLHVPGCVNVALWCLALITLITIFITYSLKCIFYFEAVRREYFHPVRVNFFFAPWIACMFLTLGIPPAFASSVHPVFWCLFMTPIFILELKIYGQWLSGGERRLSKVANPSTHLSLVGNFIGALLAARVGWNEAAIFFWGVGLAHYLVLFVTLYQRLPSMEALPKELHPVFFLFVAAPNAASVAWENIKGNFDSVSRISYFLGLFLYSSLVVRLNFFRGVRFSVAWWAYTFPMTAAAIATIHYSEEVVHPGTQALAALLSVLSIITVFTLFMITFLHAVVWGTLFPNDMAIAITSKSIKKNKKGKKSTSAANHLDDAGYSFLNENVFLQTSDSSMLLPAEKQQNNTTLPLQTNSFQLYKNGYEFEKKANSLAKFLV